jgi:hypothetical protein
MTNADKPTFYLRLDTLAEVFRLEISITLKRAYFAALEDLPLAALEDACRQAIKSEKFMPVPATLRELAGFPTDVLSAAESAWLALRNLACRYNREALSDPLTRTVFDAMGGGYHLDWGFGNWPLEQEDRKRREFLARYREAHNAQRVQRVQSGAPTHEEPPHGRVPHPALS